MAVIIDFPAMSICESGGRILASIGIGQIDLLRGYVNNELGDLVCVAWAFASADGHETIMP